MLGVSTLTLARSRQGRLQGSRIDLVVGSIGLRACGGVLKVQGSAFHPPVPGALNTGSAKLKHQSNCFKAPCTAPNLREHLFLNRSDSGF